MASLLGKAHYECFVTSSQFMCIYDKKSNKCLETNQRMQHRVQGARVDDITVVADSETSRYITMSGIPCKLKVILVLDGDVCMMEMFPAHTKKWVQSSDLVHLTDLASDGVWEWFPSVNFEYMSKRFWSILGYHQDEMDETPLSWMEFLNPDDKVTMLAMFDKHIESKGAIPYHGNVRYTHKEEHEVIVLCRGSIVDWLPDGTPWRMLGTHTDVTTIVKEDAVEAQSVFISRMSHEIRSPICTILNECELLGMNARTKVILDTCNQLISITDDILNLGSAKERDVTLKLEVVEVYDTLSRCSKRHKLEAKKKNIGIRVSIGDVPGALRVDVGKFNQVLDNLVNNAIKYSEKGNITIDAEYNADASRLEVRVSDEGRGIPGNIATKVFEEFVQGDKTMRGAGIGLTLARKFARLMQGDVTIEKSATGLGTTMLFTSALKQPEHREQTDTLAILVVDDMPTNRSILQRRIGGLAKAGIYPTEVIEADDGQQALDIFVERQGDVQLVLMDCLMPILNGFDATVAIHGECDKMGIEAVPVVAVTASVSPGIREKCLRHGMKYVVTKPYSEDELLASVKSCITE